VAEILMLRRIGLRIPYHLSEEPTEGAASPTPELKGHGTILFVVPFISLAEVC
jgi:hypothetical protein